MGLVLYAGEMEMGGKIVLTPGPKWRLHYYAHLDEIKTSSLSFANKNTTLGTVGATGNAVRTPARLHYSNGTIIPCPW